MSKIKKVLSFAALAVCAVLVFLYALEYYDFIFIKRPEAVTEAPVTDIQTEPVTTPPAATEPATTEPPVQTQPVQTQPEIVIDPREFPDANEAGTDGYYLTSLTYNPETMIIAELRSRLETTNSFSLRTRNWNKPVYEYESQNGEAILNWVPTEENIPAVEAYMGYLFADTGETVNIYDSYGRFLNYFNPDVYEFAYKRDTAGYPLLRQAYYYTASTKDGLQSETFKDFNYFYIAGGGIYNSDYNDAVHGRGVMSDYPAYFGTSDSGLGRKCVFNDVVVKTLKNKLQAFTRTRWNITWQGVPINDVTYYAAYPYSEGLACVADEEGIMYFVDTNGNKAFETKKEYWNTGDRYVVDRLLLPLDETTALGCYYYDHGLVKARRQIYDYYQLDTYDVMYVMLDEYVMLYKDGTEFPIPANYKVLSYSDGVMLLEKNGTFGYMDYTGAWVGNPDLEDAEHFSEGLAPCKRNGKWGMIDTAGRTVLPFIYDYIQPTSSGVIVTHSETGWNVYYKMAKQ